MYLLSITKIKYPINETKTYVYSLLDNLLKELRIMIEEKNDIIRIEEVQ